MVENLKKYDKIRNQDQLLGAVLNVMNYNYNRLYAIIEKVLEQGLKLDYVLIQRIGLYGRAEGVEEYSLLKEKLEMAFNQIDRINNKLGIESIMVDAFPLCLIPEEYHKYLARCDWGYGTAALDMIGNIYRCAVAEHCGQNLLGNILLTPTEEIWENSPTLIKFRSKEYLRKECQECNELEKCGGGCSMSCGNNILSTDVMIRNLIK